MFIVVVYIHIYIDTYLCLCSRGVCTSNRDMVQANIFSNGGSNQTYDEWDSDMIYGCKCDDGWHGSSCQFRSCPYGDDPITSGVSEKQIIDCEADNNIGTIVFAYGTESTRPIPFNSTTYIVEYELERLKAITDVTVTTRQGYGLCSHMGSITEVTFHIPQKPTYSLVARKHGKYLGYINVKSRGAISGIDNSIVSVTSTREYAECSNRGRYIRVYMCVHIETLHSTTY